MYAIRSYYAKDKPSKPNVVFILIDDLSMYGVSAYGSHQVTSLKGDFEATETSTPNIDKLAETGLLCNNAFAYPLCEPTRIALMSGQYNNRNFLRCKSQHASDITFGDTFKKAGYTTGIYGRITSYNVCYTKLLREWWLNTKFGIYFHWGPYSVPAHKTEWYSIWMYAQGNPIRKYHEETYGDLKIFGYKDFIPMFTAEKFNADEWAELFKKAGAQFAGPVAEHADGFAMWDSQLTKWDAMDMGPKRDIVGEMEKAVRKQGMKFIATYHRHWLYAWHPTWDENTDASNPEYAGLYGPKVPKGTFVMANKPTNPLPDATFNQEWLDRLNELMDKYQPDIIWFDNKMDIIGEKYRQQFLANYYNKAQEWGREVVCTYKFTSYNFV